MKKWVLLFVFLAFAATHLGFVLLLQTSWASRLVLFTNLVFASLVLPLALLSKIGFPVLHGNGWGFPAFTFLGWSLLSLFWATIYFVIARFLVGLIWAKQIPGYQAEKQGAGKNGVR